MNPLYNPLKTSPTQAGREMSMELYPNRHFGLSDNPDRQSGSGSVPTRTRTRSDGPDPLLTLAMRPQRSTIVLSAAFLGKYANDKIVTMSQNERQQRVNDLCAGILDNLTGVERT